MAYAILPNHLLIRVAHSARCTIISVRSYVQGGLRRASTIERIETALRQHKLDSYLTRQCTYPNAPIQSAAVSSVPGSKA